MSSLAMRLVRSYGRTSAWLDRGRRAFDTALGEALRCTLHPGELGQITIALYDESLPQVPGEPYLYPWEQPWFERWLPRPPASLLIGAAGEGREAACLRARGYEVWAFEPGPRAAARCAHRLGEHRVVAASYDDFCRAALNEQSPPPLPLQRLTQRTYDAVILGWGSLSHVLEREARARLLAAVARVCSGPCLATYYAAGAPRGAGGVARALGHRVGSWVGGVRGAGGSSEPFDFAPWRGFSAHMSSTEPEGYLPAGWEVVHRELTSGLWLVTLAAS